MLLTKLGSIDKCILVAHQFRVILKLKIIEKYFKNIYYYVHTIILNINENINSERRCSCNE